MSTTVPAAGPLDVIVGNLYEHKKHLLRQARAVDRLIANIAPGESWRDVHSVDLEIGTIYVVRRSYADNVVGEPGLSKWTTEGWRDEFGSPLTPSGRSVDVLVPNAIELRGGASAPSSD